MLNTGIFPDKYKSSKNNANFFFKKSNCFIMDSMPFELDIHKC